MPQTFRTTNAQQFSLDLRVPDASAAVNDERRRRHCADTAADADSGDRRRRRPQRRRLGVEPMAVDVPHELEKRLRVDRQTVVGPRDVLVLVDVAIDPL